MLRTVRCFEYLFLFFKYQQFVLKKRRKALLFQSYHKRQIIYLSTYFHKWSHNLMAARVGIIYFSVENAGTTPTDG